MSSSTRKLSANGREWTVVTISNSNGSIDVVPAAGFSIISFKWKGRELLDQWDINTFLGAETDIEYITNNITDAFRKGFGPSIGPWFGQREESGKYWQHGVCRFADWKNPTITGDCIKGRLIGKNDKLLGKTLNDICGFDFAAEISYTLTNEGLEYRVKNLSEGNKGTFGIHWYWKSPKDTKIRLKTDLSRLPKDYDEKKYTKGADEVMADMNIRNGHIFRSAQSGVKKIKGQILYADGSNIDFYYDDAFEVTVLFNTKDGCCFEPVSGMPYMVGAFKEGMIKICPKV
jgi:galactose mutarotase-like enzyme